VVAGCKGQGRTTWRPSEAGRTHTLPSREVVRVAGSEGTRSVRELGPAEELGPAGELGPVEELGPAERTLGPVARRLGSVVLAVAHLKWVKRPSQTWLVWSRA
jgi:hypothetical protein